MEAVCQSMPPVIWESVWKACSALSNSDMANSAAAHGLEELGVVVPLVSDVAGSTSSVCELVFDCLLDLDTTDFIFLIVPNSGRALIVTGSSR